MKIKQRCSWCLGDDDYVHYHDHEWGVPTYDDQQLFELLMLEGMQAGLSWITVLKKRDAFRAAFYDFNPEKIVQISSDEINQMLLNKDIIRHRLKLEAIVNNAKAYLRLSKDMSLSSFLWCFVDGQTIQNNWTCMSQVPASTEISKAMAKALKNKGFKFVGETICYAFMQASGMVNDHLVTCHRHKALVESV